VRVGRGIQVGPRASRNRFQNQFVIAIGSDKNSTDVQNVIDAMRASSVLFPTSTTSVIGETYDALNASDVAAITSGTATLEAGIIGTPMAIVYKTSLLNYSLLEPLISVEHYGLINLIAGKRLASELIQHDLTAESLANELVRLMQPSVNSQMRAELATAVDKLGRGGASKRAAEAIFKLLQEPNPDAC
jgi:lipid-A-disaccharide synthase